ncbi:hypothetical protein KL912_001128 [Ogataea haglerorum]|nr:hypothetical protein KL912_001128 [Ogataea haglerorum]KAG7804409.1 hypothetical protein KL944_000155 [Ogataea haglerorum]
MSRRDVSYIQSRLDALQEVDVRLVSMLDNLSTTLGLLKSHKEAGVANEAEFKNAASGFYAELSRAAVSLSKEVKIINNKVTSQTGERDLLPVQINKKSVWVNDAKLREEIQHLDQLADFKNIEVPPDEPERPEGSPQDDKKIPETIDLDAIDMSDANT